MHTTASEATRPPHDPTADFASRVAAYHALREQLMREVPPLAGKVTPEALDAHQRALAALIVRARRSAKPGDIFVPDMQVAVRRLMARVFSDPAQRAGLKATIAEENPAGVVVAINTRYPDDVPMATMPPDVLKHLPPLPTDCEYRFVGEWLILLDTRAHLVVDVMSFALPKN